MLVARQLRHILNNNYDKACNVSYLPNVMLTKRSSYKGMGRGKKIRTESNRGWQFKRNRDRDASVRAQEALAAQTAD